MRTTLNIDDNLIDRASKMTGIKEKTTLVKLGLEALIARERGGGGGEARQAWGNREAVEARTTKTHSIIWFS